MRDASKLKPLIYFQETLTYIRNTITLLNRTSFQPQDTIFLYSYHPWLPIFTGNI